ncbi:hypothetical protein HanPSC8_Chr06g0240081 [Helianthus annuus]|nr:hypothetical protein HanPSC8_Chr06g0240081 [Helianthus annuus]
MGSKKNTKAKEIAGSSNSSKRARVGLPTLNEDILVGDEIQDELDNQLGGRDQSRAEALPDWETDKRLSSFNNKKLETLLYKSKMMGLINGIEGVMLCERLVNPEELRLLGITQKFERLGWEAALTFCENKYVKVYVKAVEQWMSTLRCIPGDHPSRTMQLIGDVGRKKMVMSMEHIRKIAYFDSGPQNEYLYPDPTNFFSNKKLGTDHPNIKTDLFVEPSKNRTSLNCEARVLQNINLENIMARLGDRGTVKMYDVRVVHAIMTGRPRFSFMHLALMNVWESRESKERKMIPHVRLLCAMMEQQGVVTKATTAVKKDIAHIDFAQTKTTGLTYDQTSRYHVLKEKGSGPGRTLKVLKDDAPPSEDEEEEEDDEPDAPEPMTRPRIPLGRQSNEWEALISQGVQGARSNVYGTWSNFHKEQYGRITRSEILQTLRYEDILARMQERQRVEDERWRYLFMGLETHKK